MKVLVTGGSGFLGRNLIRALTKEKFEVISCSRTRSSEDVPQINCDINELSPWHLQDTKMVIHCAAKVGFSGRYSDFYKVNCFGTQNLISSCLKAGVKYFIYISSPSVVFDGHHIVGGDETLPYATKPKSFYAATKAIAERMILSEKNLKSVILRPHLIFGPDDTNLLPAIIKALKSGKLFRWCEEDYLADFTYIEDCVDAILKTIGYICNSTDLHYKVFFVSSGQPVGIWEFISEIARHYDFKLNVKKLPLWLIQTLAAINEVKLRFFEGLGLTRTLVDHLTQHHFFDIARARAVLGYNPTGNIFEKLKESLKKLNVD